MIYTCTGKSYNVFTSITDLYKERHISRYGWVNTDGSLISNTSKWSSYEPNEFMGGEDCVKYTANGLKDTGCKENNSFVCVSSNGASGNKKTFVKDDINIYNNDDNQEGCYENVAVRSKLQCGNL